MTRMDLSRKTAIATVVLGASARLLPHPWNFTPMVAIGLFTGAQSSKLRTGVLATLAALVLSDAALYRGAYPGWWYVYAAWLVPVLIGRVIRGREGMLPIAAGALASSVSFFLLTNFMVWVTYDLYPHTLAGLAACYAAAIPFYQNQILGDACYTAALFGGHAVMLRLLQPAPRTV